MRRRGQLVSISIALGVALGGTTISSGPAGSEPLVRAAGWGPVVNLSAPAPSRRLLPTSVSVDTRGNALAVWVDTDESRSPLMSAFRPAGRPWRHAVPVPGSRGAADADVAFDGAGEAVVTWFAGRRIVASRRTAGGSWTRPVTVYRSAASIEPRPPNSLDLAVNEHGRSVLTWEGRGAKVAIGFSDGRWGSVRTLSRNSGGADAVVDRWGRVTAIWGEGAWAGRVMTASRDVGGPWTKPRPLTRTQVGTGGPIIDVRRDGEVAVAWETPAGGSPGIRVARKPRGGGWVRTAPTALGRDAWKPRMGMDGSGVVTVAWSNLSSGALWRIQHSPGVGWTRKVRVAPPRAVGDDYWLAVNDAGAGLLGWTSEPGAHAVQAVYRSRAGVWQRHPRTLSEGSGRTAGPALALGASGAAVVVWAFQPTGATTTRVQATRFTR